MVTKTYKKNPDIRKMVPKQIAIFAIIEAMKNPTMLRPRKGEGSNTAALRVSHYAGNLLDLKQAQHDERAKIGLVPVDDGESIIQALCEHRPDLAARWIAELVISGRIVRYGDNVTVGRDDDAQQAWNALDASLERWAGLIGWDDEPAGGYRHRMNELARILKIEEEQ